MFVVLLLVLAGRAVRWVTEGHAGVHVNEGLQHTAGILAGAFGPRCS